MQQAEITCTQECSKNFSCEENISKSNNAGALAVGAKQQKYTVIPGGEAGGILPPEGCSRESRSEKLRSNQMQEESGDPVYPVGTA